MKTTRTATMTSSIPSKEYTGTKSGSVYDESMTSSPWKLDEFQDQVPLSPELFWAAVIRPEETNSFIFKQSWSQMTIIFRSRLFNPHNVKGNSALGGGGRFSAPYKTFLPNCLDRRHWGTALCLAPVWSSPRIIIYILLHPLPYSFPSFKRVTYLTPASIAVCFHTTVKCLSRFTITMRWWYWLTTLQDNVSLDVTNLV